MGWYKKRKKEKAREKKRERKREREKEKKRERDGWNAKRKLKKKHVLSICQYCHDSIMVDWYAYD